MEYLFYISLGWFIIEFEPFKIGLNEIQRRLPNNSVIEYVFGAFDCWQCATFWSSWVVSGSFSVAVVSSFLTFTIELVHEIWSRKR